MSQTPLPNPPSALARALTARMLANGTSRLQSDLTATFEAAVVELEAADRTYQNAIASVVAPSKAEATLAEMTAYRAWVTTLRERVRTDGAYADFDPLDGYDPNLSRSHAETVRVARMTDAARQEVADVRTQFNARLTERLDRIEIERLIEAKRVRNAAFDRILRGSLSPDTGDKLATQLLLLVDGWF